VGEPTLEDVVAILDRFKEEPVTPFSALGEDREEIRKVLEGACWRRLADPAAPERWRSEHDPTTPLPRLEKEPRKAWRARRSLAERGLVDLQKFVPDADSLLVHQFLEARRGRALPIEAAERERARSILKTVRRNQRAARQRAAATHYDSLLWQDVLHPERPVKGIFFLLTFAGIFLIPWTIGFAVAMGSLSPANFVFPGHPWVYWIALFAFGWILSTVVPLLYLNWEAAEFVLILVVPFFPPIVAFIEVGLLRLLGWL
jgi:hypothetical protein